jgi:hypothetical protein
MEITTIAKTQPKDSYSINNSQFYTEYAIGKVETEEEKDGYYKKYGVREIYGYRPAFVALRRRIDIIDNNIFSGDYDFMDVDNSPFRAACKFGDSVFYTAISLNPLHNQVIDRSNKLTALQGELKALEDSITPCKFQRNSNLAAEYESRYTQELKEKRLTKKVLNNTAPVDVVNEIKSRLQTEYKAELNRINTRIDEIKTQLDELK